MTKLLTLLGPLLLLLLYGVVVYLLRGYITLAALLEGIAQLYHQYGYLVVFLAAWIEATFPIGLYVPGSTAVLFGAAIARTGAISFPIVYIIGTSGMVLGYVGNYFFGRYGWYHIFKVFGLEKGIDQAKKRLEQHGKKAIFVGYLWPGGGAFISTAAGVIRMPFLHFFFTSLVSQLFWSSVWGGLAYWFGMAVVEFFIKYAIIFGAIGIAFFMYFRWKKK